MRFERPDQSKFNVSPRAGSAVLLAALALVVFAGTALAANLVKNGSFEKANAAGFPNKWSDNTTGGVPPKRVCNQSQAGSCSLMMKGDGGEKIITQLYFLSGLSGDTYKLTAWVKGKQIDNTGSPVFIALHFHHLGGGSNDFDSEFALPANGTYSWTKHTISQTATVDFDYILVVITYDQDVGKAWFDQVKVVQSP